MSELSCSFCSPTLNYYALPKLSVGESKSGPKLDANYAPKVTVEPPKSVFENLYMVVDGYIFLGGPEQGQ